VNQPDLDVILTQWWGGAFDSSILGAGIGGASNIIIGTNPAYGESDFLSIYPKFGSLSDDNPPVYAGLIPKPVLDMYIALALACLMQARWVDQWKMGMGLFIAHYCTLYLQSEGNAGTEVGRVAASGLAKGVLVNKSAGGVSAGLESLVSDWGSWGAFNLTLYGQQLMTMGKMIGAGGMYIF
jgi:hypothetical protein